LSGDLPSLTPRLGKIPDLLIVSILVPRVVTNTIIAAGDVAPARTEEPIIDIGAEDNSLKASEESFCGEACSWVCYDIGNCYRSNF